MNRIKMVIYWLLYKIVRFEPTLNFGWLKQSTVAVSSCSNMRRGDAVAIAGKTIIVIGIDRESMGRTMTFIEGDRA